MIRTRLQLTVCFIVLMSVILNDKSTSKIKCADNSLTPVSSKLFTSFSSHKETKPVQENTPGVLFSAAHRTEGHKCSFKELYMIPAKERGPAFVVKKCINMTFLQKMSDGFAG